MPQHKHVGVYALAIENNSVLLIKKARGPYTGTWDLPGGGLEFGEEPLEGLSREVMEETGLTVKSSQLLDMLSNRVSHLTPEGEKQDIYHLGTVYKVTLDLTTPLKTTADGEDSHGAKWINITEIDLETLSPFARQCISHYLSKENL